MKRMKIINIKKKLCDNHENIEKQRHQNWSYANHLNIEHLCENHEIHENKKNPQANHKNIRNHRNPCENNESHQILAILEIDSRTNNKKSYKSMIELTKIMKIIKNLHDKRKL